MTAKKPSPAITLMQHYIQPQTVSGGFSGYLNYLNRSSATIPQQQNGQYIRYLTYLDNPEKDAELFTEGNDGLTKTEKQELQDLFDLAEQNGSPLWQTVFSFNTDWLTTNRIYDPETNLVDDQALKSYTRGAMSRLLEKENMLGTAVWAGAIHYDTDNIHIHVATTEPFPTRQPKTYRIIEFPNQWLTKQKILTPERLAYLPTNTDISSKQSPKYGSPVLRELKSAIQEETGVPFFCRNTFRITPAGNLQLTIGNSVTRLPKEARVIREIQKPNGKFKLANLNQAKRYVIQEINRDQVSNQLITNIIRQNLVEPVKKHAQKQFVFNESLMVQYQNLYGQLVRSGVKPGQWNYNMNKLSNLRPLLNHLSKEYIQKYHAKEYAEFEAKLDKKAEEYQKTYGGENTAKRFKQNKIHDLYQRMGNAILSTLRSAYQSQNHPEKEPKIKRTRPSGPRYTDTLNLGAFLDGLEQATRWGRQMRRNLNNTWLKSQEQRFLEEEIAIEEGRLPDRDI